MGLHHSYVEGRRYDASYEGLRLQAAMAVGDPEPT